MTHNAQSLSKLLSQKQMKTENYGKPKPVLVEWFWRKMAVHLLHLLLKNMLYCVQECVKITEEGKPSHVVG
jgi:hypothetical protein